MLRKILFFLVLLVNLAYADSPFSLVNSIPPLTADNALNDVLISDNGNFIVFLQSYDSDAYIYQNGVVAPLDIPGGKNNAVKLVKFLPGDKKILIETDKTFYVGMFKQGWQKIPFPNLSKGALIDSIAVSDQGGLTLLLTTDDGTIYSYSNKVWQQLVFPGFSGVLSSPVASMSEDGSVRLIHGFQSAQIYQNGQWRQLQDPALPKQLSITNVLMSRHGDFIIISTEGQGNYIYENSQWEPINVNGKNNQGLLTSLAMTNNEKEIIAAIEYDAFYLYKNGQWSRIEQTINPNIEFSSAVISQDGDKILIGCSGMGAFMYQDGQWKKITISGASDDDVNAVRMSKDGNVFAILGGTYTAFNINGKWKYLLGPED